LRGKTLNIALNCYAIFFKQGSGKMGGGVLYWWKLEEG